MVENGRVAAAVERHGSRFLERIFHPAEAAYCQSMQDPGPHLAARFAAKEAVAKAFGTGFAGPVSWRDIEIRRKASGEPFVVLHAGAADLAKRLGVHTVLISLSHSQNYSVANALLLTD